MPDRIRHVHDAAGGRDRALAAADAHLPAGRRRPPARRRRASSASRAIRTGATTSCSTSTSTATTAPGSAQATRPAGPAWSRSCCSRADPRPHAAARARTLPWERGPRRVRRPAASNAPIQAPHRVCRHALQRLADPEERTDCARRDRSRGSDGDGPTGVRAVRVRPDGRRRARARTGGAPGRLHDARARAAPQENQRRASRGHPHPIDRQGAASLPRAPRCPVAELPLSNLTSANGVREAVRVVDSRAAWTCPPCGALQAASSV